MARLLSYSMVRIQGSDNLRKREFILGIEETGILSEMQ